MMTGGIMKQMVIICLLSVFLATNNAHAIPTDAQVTQFVEKAQSQELTEEDVAAFYNELMTDSNPAYYENQSKETQDLLVCLQALASYAWLNAILYPYFGTFTYILTFQTLRTLLYWWCY
jgi:hypothetical protein